VPAVTLPGPRSALAARVRVPPSKSLTNRALIACAVAGGGVIERPLDCDDTRVLAGALAAAGWQVDWGDELRVGERAPAAAQARLWLGDSGTGARLILALLAATPGRFVVDGSRRLRERPIRPLLEALNALGARLESAAGCLPVAIEGSELAGGAVAVRAELSSQFVSALLLAAPLMRHGLALEVDGPLPSAPYVELTVGLMRQLGIDLQCERAAGRWRVPAGRPRPSVLTIEGDWSAAAFFAAAAAVAGGRVEIEGANPASAQGDRVVTAILGEAGVRCTAMPDALVVDGPATRALGVDLTDAPDLFPALAVVAAALPAGSRIAGIERLRHKESDRLSAMVENLRRLGAELEVVGQELRVTAAMSRHVGNARSVTAAGDHRIAMAMAVAALHAGPLELDDPSCVAKSFPGFWKAWQDLCGATDRGGASP
jgi:3-phosphoshikimate 1-carboxyvinyltransferase